jgi:signal transduction histidine kinase/AraC-like DNA-binding protein/ligand-binding sensor domain-containing protein
MRISVKLYNIPFLCFIWKARLLIFALYQLANVNNSAYAQRPYNPITVDPLSEPWRWRHFPELAGKGIRSITESDDGYIWFGVDKGIIRYYGIKWQTFNEDNGFLNVPVNHLCKSKDQSIYAGTDSGLYKYSANHWVRVFPAHPYTSLSKAYQINCLRALSDGSIVASIGLNMYGGLLLIRNNRITIFLPQNRIKLFKGKAPNTNFVAVPENYLFNNKFNIEELFADRQNRIWVATRNVPKPGSIFNIQFLRQDSDIITYSQVFNEKNGLKQGRQTLFGQSPDNNIWMINGDYDVGVSIYNGQHWKYFQPSDHIGEDDMHTSFLKTHDGTVWIGGFGVLYSVKNGNWKIYNRPGVLIPNARTLLFEDSKGYLWIIGRQNDVYQVDYSSNIWDTYKQLNYQCQTNDGKKWFLSVDGRVVVNDQNKWYSYGTEDGLPDAPVRLYLTTKNILWVAGSHKSTATTAYFDGKKWIMQLHPALSWGVDYRAVFEDIKGNLWFGGCVNYETGTGHSGGVLRLENQLTSSQKWTHFLPQEDTRLYSSYGIGQSKNGDIWFGGSHLVKYDGKKMECPSEPNALIDYQDVLASKPRGMLWVGSRNYGIFQNDGKNWIHFGVENGLSSNTIISILPVSDNNVWVATDKDICRFDGKSWILNVFPPKMTLNREGGDLQQSPEGNLWINQCFREWKRRALKGNKISKDVYDNFQTIRYKPGTLPPQTTIKEYAKTVSHYGNTVISWSARDFWKVTPDSRLAYSYRLNGGKWSEFKEKTYETFMGLASGKYVLEVRSRDLDFNIDPNPAKVEFEVLPPIWRQSWFILLLTVFIATIALYEYRAIRRNHKLSRLNKSLSKVKIQLEEQKEQILEQNKREQENNQLKFKFFTSISHEFRTPLTLILGSIDKIIETNHKTDKTTGKYLKTLYRSAQQLLRLINQLMDFRKLETESMNLKVAKGNITRFINNICETFSNLAQRYQIKLIFESKTNNLMVWFDVDKVEKIMFNLISNALKFTPDGGVIKVSLFTDDLKSSNQLYYYITVEDTGLGIPDVEIERIFDPFYQSSIQQIRKYEGTGIGLALVKYMVQLHHGELKVTSSIKDVSELFSHYTTCFTIKLPLGDSHFKSEEIDLKNEILPNNDPVLEMDETEEFHDDRSQINSELSDDRQKPFILIVEDNEDLQRFIFDFLHEQYVVILSKNGIEGYIAAVEYMPDLIVSDIMMPLMSGTEMCHKLKNDQRTSHIPIILLTARTTDEHKIEGYQSGADDYVSKPFNNVLLSARIKNLIDIRIALRKAFKQEIVIQSTETLTAPVDANFLDKVIVIIEKNMDNSNFDVEMLSKSIGISNRHLLNKLQNLTDSTPVELIRTLRLKRAKELLLQKKTTIAEIAYEVGFSDPNYFSKCFGKQYGKPPKEFIESNQKIN